MPISSIGVVRPPDGGISEGPNRPGKAGADPQNVKRWVSDTLTPMLAVICATPGGEEWLLQEILRGIARWKDRHRNVFWVLFLNSKNSLN